MATATPTSEEKLNRLMASTNGKAKGDEAAAEAPAKPTPAPKATDLKALPKGEQRELPLSKVPIDEQYQMRCMLFDEHHVAKLEEAYRDGEEIEPVRVVELLTGDFILYDGFQRRTAAERAKKKTINAIVTPGTRDDAFFYAMRCDTAKALPRTREDCRRTVLKAINTPDVYCRIKASAEKYGGLNRALAAATSTSKGTVANVLKASGLVIKRGEILKEGEGAKRVAKKKAKAKEDLGLFAPMPDTSKTKAAGLPDTFDEFQKLPAAEQKKINASALAAMSANVYADRVKEAQSIVRRLGAIVVTLLLDKKNGERVRGLFKKSGLPIGKSWDYKPGSKEEGEAYYALLEDWPTLRDMAGVFRELAPAAAAAE